MCVVNKHNVCRANFLVVHLQYIICLAMDKILRPLFGGLVKQAYAEENISDMALSVLCDIYLFI